MTKTKTQLIGASIVTAALLIALTSLIIPCTAAATEKYAAELALHARSATNTQPGMRS
jgi:hypothetical protein